MSGVIVHEWIAQKGGSENVVQVLSQLYPDADVMCLWNDSVGRFDPDRIRETWLARTPLRRSKALALPFMPTTWRNTPDHDYEWAIVSSHLFAHHVRFKNASFNPFVYVHSPARYLWNPELDTRGNKFHVKLLAGPLRWLDRRRAQENKEFAANSLFVKERIERAWKVPARVIHPPVQVESIQAVQDWSSRVGSAEVETLELLPESFLLGASRFVEYKRLDVVIAAGESTGLPVVIAGNGPELPRLQEVARSASVPVHIVLDPSDELLRALYERTSAYVFPAVEDFGIMPVEAMAAGAPVVIGSVGGTTESVLPGVSGAIADFASPASVRSAVDTALGTRREDRQAHARNFSVGKFADSIAEWTGIHG